MNVLVIGGGGREHALVKKISESNKVSRIFCAPSNAGIDEIATRVNISSEDIDSLKKFALNEKIDLTVVGPDNPLADGIVDEFINSGLRIFGPKKEAAMLEGSKVICKEFLMKHDIPTARYVSHNNYNEAVNSLKDFSYPLVIKADGLAAGKGVIIADNEENAIKTLEDIMVKKQFGSSGERVVIEEFLDGVESSMICIVDNNTILTFDSAKDYKRAYDNDEGLNTGGMGCYSPSIHVTEEIKELIKTDILDKTLKGLKIDNIDYRGILFIGIMIVNNKPYVLEFNARFGDPETQVLLPRLKNDIIDVFNKCIDNELKNIKLDFTDDSCVCITLASEGYPVSYEKGKEININSVDKDVYIYHAGTALENGKLLTNGGRVISLVARDKDVNTARKKAYNNVNNIQFEGMFYRTDIANI